MSNYVELMSKFETFNRPPGGILALNRIVSKWPQKNLPVIDVGCNSGYTTIEINWLRNCEVVGIDISDSMIDAANINHKKIGSSADVSFISTDIIRYESKNNSNIIFSGGSTIFTENWKKTVSKYIELAGPEGFCSEIWFVYNETPDESLVRDLEETLGFKVPVLLKKDLIDFYNSNDMEIIDLFELPVEKPRFDKDSIFIDTLKKKPNVVINNEDNQKLQECYSVFAENSKILSTVGITYRQRKWSNTEWFVNDFSVL